MWTHLVSAALGAWLMAAPAILGHGGPAATSGHIAGPLVVTFALIAVFSVTRAIRWLNVALAAWLVLAPALLGFGRWAAINSAVTGLLVGALSLVRGRVGHSYAGGWRALFARTPRAPPGATGYPPRA